jgi:hypothetical protein
MADQGFGDVKTLAFCGGYVDLNPTTLHPTPYTPNPKPHTLHPKSQTPHHRTVIQNPEIRFRIDRGYVLRNDPLGPNMAHSFTCSVGDLNADCVKLPHAYTVDVATHTNGAATVKSFPVTHVGSVIVVLQKWCTDLKDAGPATTMLIPDVFFAPDLDVKVLTKRCLSLGGIEVFDGDTDRQVVRWQQPDGLQEQDAIRYGGKSYLPTVELAAAYSMHRWAGMIVQMESNDSPIQVPTPPRRNPRPPGDPKPHRGKAKTTTPVHALLQITEKLDEMFTSSQIPARDNLSEWPITGNLSDAPSRPTAPPTPWDALGVDSKMLVEALTGKQHPGLTGEVGAVTNFDSLIRNGVSTFVKKLDKDIFLAATEYTAYNGASLFGGSFKPEDGGVRKTTRHPDEISNFTPMITEVNVVPCGSAHAGRMLPCELKYWHARVMAWVQLTHND